jgi:ribosomal protein L7/L12
MDYQDYFQSYQDYFWQWEDNREVIAIPESNTIAYRGLVESVLEKLAAQGLPPFGTLLLAIIATNPNGATDIDTLYSIALQHKAQEDNSIHQAISFLKLLSELPPEYKQGSNRLLLFQTIFETCHNRLSNKTARRIISDYRTITVENQRLEIKASLKEDHYKKDIMPIALLNRKFPDVKTLLSKMSAVLNIEEDLKELNSNLNNRKEQGDWVQKLLEEHATNPIGVLINHIWSALSIPFHNSLPSKQPLGGVSDLTNKGDFDKLLISEFANDDLVFLSRLANNEALYLNREIPPVNNNVKRVLIIDVSIKTWGTPKTIAYAVMLAIARHPKTDIECIAFSVGNTYHPISFSNVDELIVSLRHIEGCLNPVKGLESFIKEHTGKIEVFLISVSDNLKSPEMLKLMSDHHDFFTYCIYITAGGKVSLFKRQQNNSKHIQDFQLPLDELWTRHADKQKTGKYLTTIPILVKTPQNALKTLSTDDGEIFQITPDQKLFRFYDRQAKRNEKGWELVAENLPFSSLITEIGLTKGGDHVLMLFAQKDKKLFFLNLNSSESRLFTFEEWMPSLNSFIFHDNQFHFISAENNWMISISLDGIITRNQTVPRILVDNHTLRTKKLNEVHQKMIDSWVQLKNVQQLFINDSNNLVFNTHELYVNNNGVIKLDQSASLNKTISAEKISKNKFLFAEGSTIEVKRAGLLVLKSSNTRIPYIYVPSALDSNLGVATSEAFTGNTYYLKSHAVNVILESAGAQPLQIVKLIREFSDIGLRDAKMLVDSTPACIAKNIAQPTANEFKKKLELAGASVSIEDNKHTIPLILDSLSSQEFFNLYIHAFIKTIRNGTKN